MKIINNISATLLACFFLLSNNGISLILHHCFTCDTTDYYVSLFTAKIEHSHHDDDHSFHGSCHNDTNGDVHEDHHAHGCGIFAGDNEGCETRFQYLKNEYELLLKNLSVRLLQLVSLPIDISTDDLCCSECIAGKIIQDYIEPPPRLVSKTFIIFANQLKIC